MNNLVNIKNWLDEMGIINYTINDDLTVDVDGDVDLSGKTPYRLPVKFKVVTGDFDISDNDLVTLDGSPICCLNFKAYRNQITDLIGGPHYVLGNYNVSENRLSSLKGMAFEIDGLLVLKNNRLECLDLLPLGLGDGIMATDNPLREIPVRGRPSAVFDRVSTLKHWPTFDIPTIQEIEANRASYEKALLNDVVANKDRFATEKSRRFM